MADNTTMGSTDTIATDDLGSGVKVQRAKVGFGADGSLTDVSAAAPLPVQPSDGTTAVSVLAGDTGQNSLAMAGARKEVTFSFTTAANGTAYDVSNYRWVSVQITAVYTGMSSMTFQISNDNSTWVSTALTGSVVTTANTGVSAVGASAAMYHGPLVGKYFRLVTSGSGSSGSTVGTIVFSAVPSALQAPASAIVLPATTGSSSNNINTARATGTGTASATSLVSGVSGLSIYVTDIYAANSGSTATLMTLLPASGTAVHDFMVPAGLNTERSFKTPWKLASNTALHYTNGSATSSWFLTVHYYLAA